MISNDHAFTATNKIKRPSYSTVVTWVKDSWEEVSVNLIKNSFKCCGISTELDGSDGLLDYWTIGQLDYWTIGPCPLQFQILLDYWTYI